MLTEDLFLMVLTLSFVGSVLTVLCILGLLCWWLIKDLRVRLWED